MNGELSSLMFCVFLLVISGAMGGSFYVPFSKVKQWSWETYWLAQGLVAWLILPVLLTWLTVPRLLEVLYASPAHSLVMAYLFGAMWGVGSLMCGLSLRYLGISLGMALLQGFCAAFGTLIPPIIDGTFGDLLGSQSGLIVLLGVAVALLGIAACGYAGICKELELNDAQKSVGVKEFALGKGFVLATLCGIMSAGMILGVWAGSEIGQVSIELGTPDAYRNNTVFMIVLAGGFSVNLVWCLTLGIKKRSVVQYVSGSGTGLLVNYALVSLAGFLWYAQIFFYGVSRAKMGKYDFASWAIFLSFVIAFSTIWGLILKEWKGVSRRTLAILWSAILILILSAVITSMGSCAEEERVWENTDLFTGKEIVDNMALGSLMPQQAVSAQTIGTPIVTYWWAGSVLTDAIAQQAVKGGYNTVWVSQYEGTQQPSMASQLAIAEQYNLRTILWSDMFTSTTLGDPVKLTQLNALIDQYKESPAAYSYCLTEDEPLMSQIPGMGLVVDHIRGRDPNHMTFNSAPGFQDMTPWGASSHEEYLSQYINTLHPPLLASSYYGLGKTYDSPAYLSHMKRISTAAKKAGVPFLNSEQVCAFDPTWRVPTASELRYLVYKSLAFGAQGISYWNYWSIEPNTGGIGGSSDASNPVPDATSEAIYAALTPLNHEFVAIAQQFQRLKWIDTYLKGYRSDSRPPGTTLLPDRGSPFSVKMGDGSDVPDISYSSSAPLKGLLLGLFGTDGTALGDATFALVQNLDYSASKTYIVTGPGDLSVFNATTSVWTATGSSQVTLNLEPGGGVLVGLASVTLKAHSRVAQRSEAH